MKKLLALSMALISLSACEVYTIEPVPIHDDRNLITGRYAMDEYSKTYDDYLSYTIGISKASGTGNLVFINNFYNADIVISAYVNGYKISIPYQVVDGYEIEGVGTISGGNIDFSYRVRDTYNDNVYDYCDTDARQTY